MTDAERIEALEAKCALLSASLKRADAANNTENPGLTKDEGVRFGELIGIARECKGWTLRDLEKVSGISNALISQIETGKVKDPGFSTTVRLCDALGLPIERAAATVRPVPSMLRQSKSGTLA